MAKGVAASESLLQGVDGSYVTLDGVQLSPHGSDRDGQRLSTREQKTWSGWPRGLRRCVQVAVHFCGRGFESHF